MVGKTIGNRAHHAGMNAYVGVICGKDIIFRKYLSFQSTWWHKDDIPKFFDIPYTAWAQTFPDAHPCFVVTSPSVSCHARHHLYSVMIGIPSA